MRSKTSEIKKLKLSPIHLRNAPTDLMRELGFGQDYQYLHKFTNHFDPKQEYLPKNLKGKIYYQPSDQGFESKIKERLQSLRKLKRRAK